MTRFIESKAAISIIVLSSLVFICILFSLIWFSSQSYESLVNFIIEKFNRPDLRTAITQSLFTEQKFQLVYKFHWVLYLLTLLVFVVVLRKRKQLGNSLYYLLHTLRDFIYSLFYFFYQLNKKEKWVWALLIIFYLSLSLYKISVRNITYDEAWNYNYFINISFYFPFVLFNTYPLYHFIAHIFYYLPFDNTVNIRLPSVLAGMVLLLVTFYITQKIFSKKIGWLIILLLFSLPVTVVFTCVAKGEIFSILFSSIIFYSAIQILTGENQKKYFVLYSGFSVLNIISMPTAAVFCAAASFFIFVDFICSKKFSQAVQFFLISILIFGLSAIFYSIPLVVYGFNFYSKEPYTPINFVLIFSRLNSFFSDTSKLFFYFPYVNLILFLLAIAGYFLSKNVLIKKILFLACIVIIADALFAVVSKDTVPNRAFAFELVPYLFIIASGISFILSKKISKPVRYIATLVFAAILISCGYYNNHDYLNPPYYQKEVKIISGLLLKHHVTTCYVNASNFWINYPVIQYYYSVQHRNWILYTADSNSTRFSVFNEKENYDCIITEAHEQQPSKNYTTIYAGPEFEIFINKAKLTEQ